MCVRNLAESEEPYAAVTEKGVGAHPHDMERQGQAEEPVELDSPIV